MYVGCRSAIAILQIEQLDACICAFLCIWIVEGACTYMYVYARCRLCRGGEGGVADFLGCQASWAVQWYLVFPSGFSRRVCMYISEA